MNISQGDSMKLCSTCDEWKEYSEYGVCKRYSDGYRGQCKQCIKEYTKKWQKEKPEIKKAIRKKYRKNNRDKIRRMDREYYEKNCEKRKKTSRESMKRYLSSKGYQRRRDLEKQFPERRKAREAIKSEVRAGRMKKPEHCQICGKIAKRIEAHHHDYFKPLEVIWLCTMCHRRTHRNY